MKFILYALFILLFTISSCEQCYNCTTKVTSSGGGAPSQTSSSKSVQCMTPSEIKKYEDAGKQTTTSTAGGITIKTVSTTTCM